MRLLLDESIPVDAAALLRDAGHDVATVTGRNAGGAGDAHLLARCRREDRTLLTLDAGFLRRTQHRPDLDPRIIVLDLPRLSASRVPAQVHALLPYLHQRVPAPGIWHATPTDNGLRMQFSADA